MSALERRAAELSAAGTAYVLATVVRAARPASVRAGDRALVLGDGRIEGFVGGACTDATVRLHAARALETTEPLLVRIVPGDDDAPSEEGAVTVHNPCLSGGELEIFLEPRLPSPRLLVAGDTPIARALAGIGERLGYQVAPADEPARDARDVALVVASHGRGEERPLAWALGERLPYVGLVASRRRGAAVLASLRAAGVPDVDVARVHTPAGIDIGARTPEEIALSILAEVVATLRAPSPLVATREAVDPVCGMVVVCGASASQLSHQGRTVFFCGDGCRRAFEADPLRYVAAL